jgi:hypothetical protein
LSCLVLSCLVLSCLILWRHVLPCLVLCPYLHWRRTLLSTYLVVTSSGPVFFSSQLILRHNIPYNPRLGVRCASSRRDVSLRILPCRLRSFFWLGYLMAGPPFVVIWSLSQPVQWVGYILFRGVSSCLVLSYIVLSCPVVSCIVSSCLLLS